MPTGTCKYSQHHGPSAGQPVALLVLIALGAVVVTHWRIVLVCVIVSVLLLAAASTVMAMWHRKHESAAEHNAWLVDRQAELERRAARQQIAQPQPTQEIHHHHVHQLPAPQPQQIHQHIHLHGLTAEDVAGVIARQAQVNPAISTGVPCTPGTEES